MQPKNAYRVRAVGVLVCGALVLVPAPALASQNAPSGGPAAPLTGVSTLVTGLLGGGSGAPAGGVASGATSALTSLLGGSGAAPAPTPTALVGSLTSAVSGLSGGNTAGVQTALAGVLGSLVGANANIVDPGSLSATLAVVTQALASGNAAGAASALEGVVAELTGVVYAALPQSLTDAVRQAVAALEAGDAVGALNALGAAVSSGLGAAAAATAGAGGPVVWGPGRGDGTVTYSLPASFGSPVGTVLGASTGSPLYFTAVNAAHAAGAGRLTVLGARLVSHGRRIRVKVRCLGSSRQNCAGAVQIRRRTKIVAASRHLVLAGGETRKILLAVRGAKKLGRHQH